MLTTTKQHGFSTAKEYSILCVGPSQQGKSTLANFLVNEEVDTRSAQFRMGDGLGACTRIPKKASVIYKYDEIKHPEELEKLKQNPELLSSMKTTKSHGLNKLKGVMGMHNVQVTQFEAKINIIDTPGAGDDDQRKEAEHMLSLYEQLAGPPALEISMALLVVAFPPFLDEKYKKTLLFYKNIFPSVFSRNLIIVVTKYQRDKKWQNQQRRAGHDPEVTLGILSSQFRQLLQLDHEIRVVPIDSLADPDPEAEDDNFPLAVNARDLIFRKCIEIPSIKLELLTFPKPITWMQEDNAALLKLEGARDGIKQGLQVAQNQMANLAGEANTIQEEIDAKQAVLDNISSEIKDKDNCTEVCIEECHFEAGLTWFWWTGLDFDVETNSKTWSRGAPVYETEDEYKIKGKVWSNYFGSLDATLSVFCTKRDRFYSDLRKLNEKRKTAEEEIYELKAKWRSVMEHGNIFTAEIERLEQTFESINRQMEQLRRTHLPIEEIQARVKGDSSQ